MADDSDAKLIDAGRGPEELDLTTLQDLSPGAIQRLQRLRIAQEAQFRRKFRDVPPIDVYCATNPYTGEHADTNEYYAHYGYSVIALPLARIAYSLFEAIGREYAQVVVDPQRFEWLLDEAQERVTNYARNRLIRIITGGPVGKLTNLPTPSRSELKKYNSDLWGECEIISATLGEHVTKLANDLIAEVSERHIEATKCATDNSEAILTDPVEPLPEQPENNIAAERKALRDAFLHWCNDLLGPGDQAIIKHISQYLKCSARQVETWAAGGGSKKFDKRIRERFDKPNAFVEWFKVKPPV